MPKQVPPRTLNLLQQSDKPMGTWDKIYEWVFNVGRYVIIIVLSLVLFAFFSRFTLDRRNNDLKDKIEVKVSMLNAQRKVEAELRQVQGALTNLSSMIDNQDIMSTRMSKILDSIPEEMTLKEFTINDQRINLQLIAPSYAVTETFEDILRNDDDYSKVQATVKSSGAGSIVEFGVVVEFATEDKK